VVAGAEVSAGAAVVAVVSFGALVVALESAGLVVSSLLPQPLMRAAPRTPAMNRIINFFISYPPC